jgi:hypothetical protein
MSLRASLPRKRLRCRVGLHTWVARVNEDEHYYACRDCGKYHESAHAIFRYPGSRP